MHIMFPCRFCATGLCLWGLVLLMAQHNEIGSNVTQIPYTNFPWRGTRHWHTLLLYMFGAHIMCIPRQNSCPRETWDTLKCWKFLIHFSLGGFWDVFSDYIFLFLYFKSQIFRNLYFYVSIDIYYYVQLLCLNEYNLTVLKHSCQI